MIVVVQKMPKTYHIITQACVQAAALPLLRAQPWLSPLLWGV